MSALIKRAIDIVGGLVLLLLNIPLFLIVPVLIKLDSKGPVFFKQVRCGLGGREFRMYKFRTMVENAESRKKTVKNIVDGPMFKSDNDPRVTRVGRLLRKTSIDELPQLLNVLKGEMSLVGPRPLALEEMSEDEAWKKTRLSVKPGATGLWQVKGRGTYRFSDWIKYDMEYVKNKSLFLDLKILAMTVFAILLDVLLWRKRED